MAQRNVFIALIILTKCWFLPVYKQVCVFGMSVICACAGDVCMICVTCVCDVCVAHVCIVCGVCVYVMCSCVWCM